MASQFAFKYHRGHCQQDIVGEGNKRCRVFAKPLSKIWETPQAKKLKMNERTTFILDDSKKCCYRNIKNWIRAPYFPMYNPNDEKLFGQVLPYLKSLRPLS